MQKEYSKYIKNSSNSIAKEKYNLKIDKGTEEAFLKEVLHIHKCMQNQITEEYYFIPIEIGCLLKNRVKELAWYCRSIILGAKEDLRLMDHKL